MAGLWFEKDGTLAYLLPAHVDGDDMHPAESLSDGRLDGLARQSAVPQGQKQHVLSGRRAASICKST